MQSCLGCPYLHPAIGHPPISNCFEFHEFPGDPCDEKGECRNVRQMTGVTGGVTSRSPCRLDHPKQGIHCRWTCLCGLVRRAPVAVRGAKSRTFHFQPFIPTCATYVKYTGKSKKYHNIMQNQDTFRFHWYTLAHLADPNELFEPSTSVHNCSHWSRQIAAKAAFSPPISSIATHAA